MKPRLLHVFVVSALGVALGIWFNVPRRIRFEHALPVSCSVGEIVVSQYKANCESPCNLVYVCSPVLHFEAVK